MKFLLGHPVQGVIRGYYTLTSEGDGHNNMALFVVHAYFAAYSREDLHPPPLQVMRINLKNCQNLRFV